MAAAAAMVLAAGTGHTFGQASSAIPIAGSLEGLSNATVTVPFSQSLVAPLPANGANRSPFALVGSCVAPTNSLVGASTQTQTNPVTAYFELTYSTPAGTTNTTTDPIACTMWGGSNVWTGTFYQNASNRVGAAGIYCDKVNCQASNLTYFSFWLTYPN